MSEDKIYKRYGPDARFTHDPEADEWWQESSFLGWYDPDSNIGGAMRLGLEPNHGGTGRVTLWSGVVTPDHAIYHRTDRLPYGPESRGARRWAATDVASFEYDDADDRLARWTLKDEGVDLKLTVEDLHTPVALFPTAGWSIHDRQARNHLECGVAVRGTVELDGRSYQVNSKGYRDHSWGIRHWNTLVAHRWMTGTLNNGRSFAMASFLNFDGTLFRAGMIIDHATDSATYSEDIDSVVFIEADGCSHRGGFSVMRMPDGSEHRFEFEPFARAPLSWHEHTACVDAPCRVRCGDAEGIAILETTTNAQQGVERPLDNLLSATIKNGLHRAPERVTMRRSIRELMGLAAPG